MKDKVAGIVSVVLHPLLMPTFLFAILFYGTSFAANPLTPDSRLNVLVVISAFTFFLPLFSVVVLRYANLLGSFTMRERGDRIIPFSFISAFYVLLSYLFISKVQINALILVSITVITVQVILLTIITLFWKISVHSIGICGVLGVLVAVSMKFPEANLLYPIICFILLTGLTMSARLQLNAHTPAQVLAGGLMGFLLSFVAIYFYI